jgi:ribonuclease BN (tRNA processing enzyme)
MTILLVPLGTNGFIPSFGRQTMSFLLLTENEALLLDAGTGVARLLEQPIVDLLRPYDCLNIILSHYHLDHVVGLSYLPGTWTRGCVRIYAPGPPFVEAVPEQALNGLLRPPLFSVTLQDFPTKVEIVPVACGGLQIGTLPIQLRAQKHPGGSMGIRIADVVAYITDTIVEQTTQTFVAGVRFLLHEVWLTDAEAESDEVERSRHSYASAVARIALEAGVGHLMPVHHHPKRTDRDIFNLAQHMKEIAGIEVVVPEEGKIYQLG